MPSETRRADAVYLVAETGFEYNDEIYYRPEGRGSHPRAFFWSETDAERYANRKNMAFLKTLFPSEVSQYGYQLEDIFDLTVLDDLGINHTGKREVNPTRELTSEDWVILMKACYILPFSVYKVKRGRVAEGTV